MEIEYREMTPAFYDGKARVHFQSWQETYPGLMPADFLAWNTYERCREVTRAHPQNTLVALCDGQVVGFACYDAPPPKGQGLAGEAVLSALYVLRAYQGLGIGRALAEECLRRTGCRPTSLLVLQGNGQAIGFYRHLGFDFTGHTLTDTKNGAAITELEMLRPAGPV